MRTELQKQKGERSRFSGVVVRFGEKHFRAHTKRTVLLRDIRDEHGHTITDHLWFNFTEGFEMAVMDPGDLISFDARVTPYWKGLDHCDLDYKLSYPTNIENEGQISYEEHYLAMNGERESEKQT